MPGRLPVVIRYDRPRSQRILRVDIQMPAHLMKAFLLVEKIDQRIQHGMQAGAFAAEKLQLLAKTAGATFHNGRKWPDQYQRTELVWLVAALGRLLL